MNRFSDMLAIMAGDKKTLEKYVPKEPKVRTLNKEGKFIIKSNFGGYDAGGDELSTKENAVIYTNYDIAKERANEIGGKVIKL